jgi:hypothetical protein
VVSMPRWSLSGEGRHVMRAPAVGSQRTLVRAVTAVMAFTMSVVLSVVLSGCGTRTSGPAPMPPATVAPDTVVMVIRHGEKPDSANPGVDANGKPDDSSLTAIGWTRAHRLVDIFAPEEGPARPGLATPVTIYAAGANDNGEGLRARETVQPLADKLRIPVDTSYGKGDETALVEHVTSQPGPTLICWQHGEIPAIAAAFPGVTPRPPSTWPTDRFDVIWTFTSAAGAWHFAQMPERALPQDQTNVIAS